MAWFLALILFAAVAVVFLEIHEVIYEELFSYDKTKRTVANSIPHQRREQRKLKQQKKTQVRGINVKTVKKKSNVYFRRSSQSNTSAKRISPSVRSTVADIKKKPNVNFRRSSQSNTSAKRISPSAHSTIADMQLFKNNLENLYGGGDGSKKPEKKPEIKRDAVNVGSLNASKTAQEAQMKLGALFAVGNKPPPMRATPRPTNMNVSVPGNGGGNSNAATDKDTAGMSKYERMLKSGLPDGAILNAMARDGIKNPDMSMIKQKPKHSNAMENSLKKQSAQVKPSKSRSGRKVSKSGSGWFLSIFGFGSKRKSGKALNGRKSKPRASSSRSSVNKGKTETPERKPLPKATTGNPLLDELHVKFAAKNK
mmetsp:Transcript_31116/g.38428  ORF Transcript_31116/g.38428 Transcript_31116/m.38428 type:complete len:367 (-) Transcript_31116:284-1384(-)